MTSPLAPVALGRPDEKTVPLVPGETNGPSLLDGHNACKHADVLGVRVSAIDLSTAVDMADRWIMGGNYGYICATGVHGVMEAQKDPGLLHILNRAFINAPDGMPMTWIGRLQGLSQMDRVFGPDFMAAMCRLSTRRGYRNFLYGGQPGVARDLKDKLQARFSGLQIVGTFTPPFRELNAAEEEELFSLLRASQPHILWAGLSTPKQEQFMARYVDHLGVPLLVGVGAAFDYHTGRIRDCSPWIKRAGMQWLHRLLQDPRRLWKRYLINNPVFIWKIIGQMLAFGFSRVVAMLNAVFNCKWGRGHSERTNGS